MKKKLMELQSFSSYYRVPGKADFEAVKDVSFYVLEGEIIGLTGSSGSGKSTLAKGMMGMASLFKGSIKYMGQDIYKRPWRKEKTKPIQMIFQDSKSTFNPRMSLFQSMEEPLLLSGVRDTEKRKLRVSTICQMVGLDLETAMKRPGECSGGQRQRANIGRALICTPKLLICDEPVSSLDASIQAQIINLLKKISKDAGVAVFFISHDEDVVRFLCDRILTMDEEGRIMETSEGDGDHFTGIFPSVSGHYGEKTEGKEKDH